MLVYERKHFPENAKIKCYGCHLYNPFLYIHDYSKKKCNPCDLFLVRKT